MNAPALLLLPLLAGLVLALVWQFGLLPNPIVYGRMDVGTVLLVVGAIFTLVSEALWWFRSRERQRAEQSRRQAQQDHADSHRRFVGRLDHEIKNPLTAIRAGLANADARDNAPALASVRTQVDRLARLAADLRKLTDLETATLEMEAVDVCQLLQELMASVQARPEAPYYHLHLNLPQAPWPIPPIRGDRDLIFLALHNLVDNALKFSAHGATIEMRAFEDGAMNAIQVADTGPGVSEEDLLHMGEELFRGRTATNVEGSGLGLALVHAIVARHAGSMKIHSRLGQGTVVTLRFPIGH